MEGHNSVDAAAEEQPAPYVRTPFWVGEDAHPEQPTEPRVMRGASGKSDIEMGFLDDSVASDKDGDEDLKAVAAGPPADPKAETRNLLAVMEEGAPFGSLSERWQSLPLPLQFLSIVVPMEIVVETGYAIWLMVLKPAERQYLTAAVLVPAFLTYYVWDAIITDNGYQLLAGMLQCFLTVLVKSIITGINAHNSGRSTPTEATDIIGYILIGCHCVTLTCGYLSFRQMGWHVHSRLSSDFRKKGADNRKSLWLLQNIFSTLKVLDFQFVVLVLVTTAVVLGQFSIPRGVKAAVGALAAVGFLFNTAIVIAVRQIVRHEQYRKYIPWVDLAMPIGIAMALLCFILPVTNPGPNGKHQFWGILVAVVLFLIGRGLNWFLLHAMVRKQIAINDVYAQKLHERDEMRPHPRIEPLMRGAWLGLPSRFRKHRKCFFQVSQDGTTLRWSWKGYVRLFYVDEIIANDANMTIRMAMTASQDLLLTFPDKATYLVWQRGLERLIAELMAPGGAADRFAAQLTSKASSANASRRSAERVPSSSVNIRRMSVDGQEATARTTRFLNTFGVKVRTVDDTEAEGKPGPFGWSSSLSTVSRNSADFSETPRMPRTITDVWERLQLPGYQGYAAALPGRAYTSAATTASELSDVGPLDKRPTKIWRDAEAGADSGAPLSASTDATGYTSHATDNSDDLAALVSSVLDERRSSAKPAQQGAGPGSERSRSLDSGPINLDDILARGMGSIDVAPKRGLQRTSQGGPSRAETETDLVEIMRKASSKNRTGGYASAAKAATDAVTSEAPDSAEIAEGHMPQLGIDADELGLTSVTLDIITLDDLKLGRLLGAGAQGEVYAGWWGTKPVAVKKFNRLSESLHELEMHMLAGRNPHVVDLQAGCHAGGSMYLVMEYFPRGTLDVMIHHSAKGRWDYVKLWGAVRSIVRGMAFLHAKEPPIFHRDLKPGNIFIGAKQGMKIGDFGMARFIGTEEVNSLRGKKKISRTLSKEVLGTIQYAAPELLNSTMTEAQPGRDDRMALAIDVYAFGVTLWEMLERRRPHEGVPVYQLQTMSFMSPQDLKLPPVKVPEGLPPAEARIARLMTDMTNDCCALQPQDRPTFAQLLARMDAVRASVFADMPMAYGSGPSFNASGPGPSSPASPGAGPGDLSHTRPKGRPKTGIFTGFVAMRAHSEPQNQGKEADIKPSSVRAASAMPYPAGTIKETPPVDSKV